VKFPEDFPLLEKVARRLGFDGSRPISRACYCMFGAFPAQPLAGFIIPAQPMLVSEAAFWRSLPVDSFMMIDREVAVFLAGRQTSNDMAMSEAPSRASELRPMMARTGERKRTRSSGISRCRASD
jgi:hypothetical protein